jgi:hypothetical protein
MSQEYSHYAEQMLTKAIQYHDDIDEHLVYLTKLSSECESILECGVRSVVSSWAFINGLLINKSNKKLLHCCDIERCPDTHILEQVAIGNQISFHFHECSDLDINMIEYDMIFIDTWHVYGHLKRELDKMNKYAKKYIVMHDTEVDRIHGESIRRGMDIHKQMSESGYTHEEISTGLEKALLEFLSSNKNWKVKTHFSHQHGLTILERIKT